MNTFRLSFTATLCIFLCDMSTQTNSIIQNVDSLVENEWPMCLVTIAKTHFSDGSTVAIVSGILFSTGSDTDMSEWFVQQMMLASQWSIVLKTIDGTQLRREEVNRMQIGPMSASMILIVSKIHKYFRESITTFCSSNRNGNA